MGETFLTGSSDYSIKVSDEARMILGFKAHTRQVTVLEKLSKD
jgi:hypothetical protein